MTDYKKLREPFPPELIGKLPATQKRPALDYVSHAAVTDRLREAAPGWEFQVLERFEADGDCWVLGRMTIDGVIRDDYGDGSDPKAAIGNAIRRCAMRWGVAIDLWEKGLQAVSSGTGDSHSTPTDTASNVAAAAVVPDDTPTSEGGSGVGITPDSAYGEGAQSDPPSDLDALIRAYGSSAKAMLAARKRWPDITSVASLTPDQRKALIGEAP